MRRRTWVVAAAGAVVAGTATVALVAQASGAACAAAAASSGQATYYAADGGGNCSFDQVSNPLVVALGNAEYAAGAACGGYLDVKGPKGTVRVKVTDRCPECAAGHLDLSRQAFAKIGDPVAGIIKVTYSKVTSPPVPGPMTVRVKEGSSRYWLALRLDNTGNPLSGVEVQSGRRLEGVEPHRLQLLDRPERRRHRPVHDPGDRHRRAAHDPERGDADRRHRAAAGRHGDRRADGSAEDPGGQQAGHGRGRVGTGVAATARR